MGKWRCILCDYRYDSELGDDDGGIPPGIKFKDLPEDWVCPLCGAVKNDFKKIELPNTSILKWSDSYSVNIREMDEQHKKLIEITNNLFYAKEGNESKEAIDKILEDLLDYTETHFTREEELLKQYKYPDYSVQKAMHDHLIKRLLDMHKKYGNGEISIDNKLALFLRHWLIDHISEEDKKYAEFLNSKGLT